MSYTDLHKVPIEDALRILGRECEMWREAQAELARAALAAQPPPAAGVVAWFACV